MTTFSLPWDKLGIWSAVSRDMTGGGSLAACGDPLLTYSIIYYSELYYYYFLLNIF